MTPLEEFDAYLAKLNSTAVGRRTFLGMVPLLMAACATGDMHRTREGNGVVTALTVDDEQKMSKELLPEIQKDYPAVQNAELQLYVKSVGAKLAKANSLEGHPYNYNFTAVGVHQVNAFALPAGTIFVTAPLLAMTDSEAELAGVLGHEIGHVKAKHAAQRIDRAKSESNKSWLYGAGGGVLGGAVGFGLGKLLCSEGDKTCLATATTLGAAAGIGGGLLIQKYNFMANTREDEMEADRIGFKAALAAGYDKDKVGSFYTKLLQIEQDSKNNHAPVLSGLTDALATHPPSIERVAQIEELSSSAPSSKNAISVTKKFEHAKKIAQEWVKNNPAQKSS